jgi:ribosomal protein L33
MLECTHCTNRTNGFERGWLAYEAKRKAEERTSAIIYCPECAERELGEDPR